MKNKQDQRIQMRKGFHREGSVMVVTLALVAVLMLLLGITLRSTSNKYLTVYQWASWQEALQGAESGADIAMNELRKDINNDPAKIAWVGWNLGRYKTVNGVKLKDTTTYKSIGSDGNFANNNGNGGGNSTSFKMLTSTGSSSLTAVGYDFITYTTNLTPHAGEGNTTLKITTTIDTPASLLDASNRQWVRVRATGTTAVSGAQVVSEEKLDNRLRKLGLVWDKVFARTVDQVTGSNNRRATRQIELVAKPVSLFSGALTAMVSVKNDKHGVVTDSFNSEGYTDPATGTWKPWPIVAATGEFNMSMFRDDPTTAMGKNGDVASNAFPIKHDKSATLDLNADITYGDVGNNYSQIKGIDPAYFNSNYDPNNPNYGLNNGAYYITNPNSNLIKTNGAGDISGNISTDYFRDMPPVTDPNWTGSMSPDVSYTKVDNKTSDLDNTSTDPYNPTRVKIGTTGSRGGITLDKSDKWTIKAAAKPGGWTVNSPTIHRYVQIWVTGDIKLDDGGTIVIEQKVDGATGKVISDVQATIYFDRNIKVGDTKETKTNAGGFDNQTDDAKNLILLGVTEPNGAQKLPKDAYTDPLGNEAVYTPYKATGNVSFNENDFTGAIYAPDHNIVFNNTKDGKGKRKKRTQTGIDFYGSFIGRTINSKGAHNFHFDESLNDAGPIMDWGYVSWFEDVDVANR